MTSRTWQHRFLNAFVVYFLIGPVMGVAWNCIWILLSEEIIYPENKEISVWISFAIGYTGSLLAAHFQDNIYQFATRHGFPFFFVVSRLYSYAMFFVSGNAWRAIWEGLDFYTGVSERNALVTSLAAYAALLILRSSRQVVFAPCVLSMDFPLDDYFKATSYFGVKKKTGFAHIGDTLFSVFFVGTLGYVVWRGFWQYMDIIIFPDDGTASGICSLVISYGINLLLTVFEPPMVWLSRKLYKSHYLLGLMFEDIVIFLTIISCINFWRGYGLLYLIFIPGGALRFWLGHYLCCLILFFSMAFNSVIARGCAFEGLETDGQGVVGGIEYLGNFTQMWKSKPDSLKRGTCANIFSTCSQAWQIDRERGDPISHTAVQLHDKITSDNPTSPQDADAFTLILSEEKAEKNSILHNNKLNNVISRNGVD